MLHRYQMKRLNKLRKINGEFIYCREIFEKNTTAVRNYGIVIKYQSRRAYHNMYREFRDTSLNGAMSQLCKQILQINFAIVFEKRKNCT